MTAPAWSEAYIARALATDFLARRYLCLVPNCNWPGNECDLMAVTENMRIIDIEIKISRADFKADASKEKWFHAWDWKIDGPFKRYDDPTRVRRRREWPAKVWKHYYAMPAEIWTPELADLAGSTNSGIVLLRHDKFDRLRIDLERKATPNRAAKTIDAADALNIARLANIRMWNAIEISRNAIRK